MGNSTSWNDHCTYIRPSYISLTTSPGRFRLEPTLKRLRRHPVRHHLPGNDLFLYHVRPLSSESSAFKSTKKIPPRSFDLTVLILTFAILPSAISTHLTLTSSVGLYLSPGRSTLWKLLFIDGIIFFAAAFISNAFPAVSLSFRQYRRHLNLVRARQVFIAINLNRECQRSFRGQIVLTALRRAAVMNIVYLPTIHSCLIFLTPHKMFSVPAACIATIVACRSFIRVATYVRRFVSFSRWANRRR